MSDEVVESESVASDDATEAFDARTDAERQRDEYLDALQRLQADFENYKKRVARASLDAATRAAGDIVTKLLPVLDAFDYAQAHFGDVAGPEAQALGQARSLLLDALSKEGLERIDTVEAAFDPQVHDAVAHVEGDDAQGAAQVDEVLRAGYRWQGVVLRPAMVKVRG
ncbi:MAG TPA: nucleotide exchange factor GrpE [Acidimicrobiales bacterium]|nr:nucleotide exchange factor GrpE [Acidimicrobiales bacterium]